MPPFQEWVIQLVGMISNILVSVAAVFGIFGLWQWRRELVGKTKYELARKIVSLALQFKDQMADVRNPFTYSGEATEREHNENECAEETGILDDRFARWKRLEPAKKTLRELQVMVWEAELLFKQDELEPIRCLMILFNNYWLAFDEWFDTRLYHATHPYEPLEKLTQLRLVVYGRDGDAFALSLQEETTKLKKKLGKYVQ